MITQLNLFAFGFLFVNIQRKKAYMPCQKWSNSSQLIKLITRTVKLIGSHQIDQISSKKSTTLIKFITSCQIDELDWKYEWTKIDLINTAQAGPRVQHWKQRQPILDVQVLQRHQKGHDHGGDHGCKYEQCF